MTEKRPGVGQILLALGKMAVYLGVFFACQIAVSYVYLYYVLGQLGPEGLSDPDLFNILMERVLSASVELTLVSGLMTLAVLAVFYFAIRRQTPAEALWLRPVAAAELWRGAALAPALYVAVSLVLAVLPAGLTEDYTEASAGLNDASPIAFLCVVFVSPLVEELIFRGLIMTRLARVMKPGLAVVVSAAVFGLCHGELIWFCYAFLLGLVFGVMDMHSGSILPSVLAHMTFNLIGQVFTTLNILLPEGRWEVVTVTGLFIVAVALVFVERKSILDLFRPLPAALEDVEDSAPAPAPAGMGPAALYQPPAGEERFDGEETYLYRDFDMEQNPWED